MPNAEDNLTNALDLANKVTDGVASCDDVSDAKIDCAYNAFNSVFENCSSPHQVQEVLELLSDMRTDTDRRFEDVRWYGSMMKFPFQKLDPFMSAGRRKTKIVSGLLDLLNHTFGGPVLEVAVLKERGRDSFVDPVMKAVSERELLDQVRCFPDLMRPEAKSAAELELERERCAEMDAEFEQLAIFEKIARSVRFTDRNAPRRVTVLCLGNARVGKSTLCNVAMGLETGASGAAREAASGVTTTAEFSPYSRVVHRKPVEEEVDVFPENAYIDVYVSFYDSPGVLRTGSEGDDQAFVQAQIEQFLTESELANEDDVKKVHVILWCQLATEYGLQPNDEALIRQFALFYPVIFVSTQGATAQPEELYASFDDLSPPLPVQACCSVQARCAPIKGTNSMVPASGGTALAKAIVDAWEQQHRGYVPRGLEKLKGLDPRAQRKMRARFIIGTACVTAVGTGVLPPVVDSAAHFAAMSSMITALFINYRIPSLGVGNGGWMVVKALITGDLVLFSAIAGFVAVDLLADAMKFTGVGYGAGAAMSGTLALIQTCWIGTSIMESLEEVSLNCPKDKNSLYAAIKKSMREKAKNAISKGRQAVVDDAMKMMEEVQG